MKILIADDEIVSRRRLESTLTRWGHEVVSTADGEQAWEALQQDGAPQLAILDWMMPGMDGPQLCRKVRESPGTVLTYVILLTSRSETEDVVAGLDAGANDYIAKPFEPAELRARVQVGIRVLELQQRLADRVKELQDALSQVRQLHGILPICSYCKKVRGDNKYWQQVEDYLRAHSGADLSHSICPECWEKHIQPEMEKLWGCKVPYEDEERSDTGAEREG